MVPTMSATDLFLLCQWWSREEVTIPHEESSYEARWGLAYHEIMAACWRDVSSKPVKSREPDYPVEVARRHGLELSSEELGRLLASAEASGLSVARYLTSGGFDGKSMKYYVEHSLAWSVEQSWARPCAPPDPLTHVYPDRKRGEFCGTADLIVTRRGGDVVLFDYKTGEFGDLHRPDKLKQLWSLAVAFQLTQKGKRGKITVATLHAPRDTGGATVFPYELTERDVTDHVEEVQTAWQLRKSGYLRPGAHCIGQNCPAFSQCPTQTANLVELKKKSGPLLTAEDVGAAHYKLTAEWRPTFARLDESIAREIRAWVEKNGEAVRPQDGKTVTLRGGEKEVARLSQTSIDAAVRDARGKGEHARADAILKAAETLRRLGAYDVSKPRPSLVAV